MTAYKCDECDSTFSKSRDYKNHYRSHSGRKPFSCRACSMRFSFASLLARHELIHKNREPVSSSERGGRFERNETFTDEQRILKEDTSGRIECSSTCSSQAEDALVGHSRSHIGMKRGFPDQCDATFERKSSLNDDVCTTTWKAFLLAGPDTRFDRNQLLSILSPDLAEISRERFGNILTRSGEELYLQDDFGAQFDRGHAVKSESPTPSVNLDVNTDHSSPAFVDGTEDLSHLCEKCGTLLEQVHEMETHLCADMESVNAESGDIPSSSDDIDHKLKLHMVHEELSNSGHQSETSEGLDSPGQGSISPGGELSSPGRSDTESIQGQAPTIQTTANDSPTSTSAGRGINHLVEDGANFDDNHERTTQPLSDQSDSEDSSQEYFDMEFYL